MLTTLLILLAFAILCITAHHIPFLKRHARSLQKKHHYGMDSTYVGFLFSSGSWGIAIFRFFGMAFMLLLVLSFWGVIIYGIITVLMTAPVLGLLVILGIIALMVLIAGSY